jgi:aspartate aminotransferase
VAAQCCSLTADLSVYQTNCRLLTDSLRAMGYHVVEPKGTFYLFPRTLEPDAAAFCRRAQDHDILIVPSDSFGCPGHFRLSFCVPTERIERALPAFEKLAATYR